MVSAPPLVVIVGPTGVGKTAVAVRLAGALPIEAVNADSRQVYRGMDVGTGKPTSAERAALPHHLLDVAAPDERYHVARFRADALRAVAEIRGRGRLPVVVGGTGLYVRALLKGLAPGPPADPTLRRELEALSRTALHRRLAAMDPGSAGRLHPNDRVRIVRAIEVAVAEPRRPSPDAAAAADWRLGVTAWRLVMVGLGLPRDALRRRLGERAREMVARGMLDEVRGLLAAGYDESLPAMGGIGYRQFAAVARGRSGEEDALRLMIRDTVRYAKRQMTWFARDPEIRWIDVAAAGGIEGTAARVRARIEEEGLLE